MWPKVGGAKTTSLSTEKPFLLISFAFLCFPSILIQIFLSYLYLFIFSLSLSPSSHKNPITIPPPPANSISDHRQHSPLPSPAIPRSLRRLFPVQFLIFLQVINSMLRELIGEQFDICPWFKVKLFLSNLWFFCFYLSIYLFIYLFIFAVVGEILILIQESVKKNNFDFFWFVKWNNFYGFF